MRILHLYRPRLPSTRAQAIQVFRTCHALATLGHEVTLFADRGEQPARLWEQMGLGAHDNLKLHISPTRHPGLTGIWYRMMLSRWWRGSPGYVLARDKKRLIDAVKTHGKRSHTIIIETHELDSLRSDGHLDPTMFERERQCISVADAIVTNCGGTLQAWEDHHEIHIPTMVCHNATHINQPMSNHSSNGLLVLGSLRDMKGVDAVLQAVTDMNIDFRWVGASATERQRWHQYQTIEPPVPHSDVATLLGQAKVLLLPIGDNAFGHRFTSPLKLWDYLATDRPIVVAKTDAIDEICEPVTDGIFRYIPENGSSIQHAIEQALQSDTRAPYRRNWGDRAAEISTFFLSLS